jgi:hypothetical protein
MTDAAFLELLADFEQSLEATRRSLVIAEALIEAQRSGRRLPDASGQCLRSWPGARRGAADRASRERAEVQGDV